MVPRGCRRLAEVDFPVADVSRHAVHDKTVRHGHPSTLHIWWARRPLAACRAMLLALLLPDPADENCPVEFRNAARELLLRVRSGIGDGDVALREALNRFVADFASWELSRDPDWLDVSRRLIEAAHDGAPPMVVDPFSGGGAIPLEGLRLGCDSFASDLNPIALLILRVLLEELPRHAGKLTTQLEDWTVGADTTLRDLCSDVYPRDAGGAVPTAYLWSRTIRCEAPDCGAEIPLLRSCWLSRKPKRLRAVRYHVEPAGVDSRIQFEVFTPRSDDEVPEGTVVKARGRCLVCGSVVAPDRVRSQLSEQRGGADVVFDEHGQRIGGATLLAVVTTGPGKTGKQSRSAEDADYRPAWLATQALNELTSQAHGVGESGLSLIPNEAPPQDGTGSVGGGYRTRKYGLHTFGDFFTARQKLFLARVTELIRQCDESRVAQLAALGLGKVVMQCNSLCRWNPSGESLMNAFGRQALPIVWDFAEAAPLAGSTGGFDVAIGWIGKVLREISRENSGVPPLARAGQVEQADACESPLPDASAHVWFTDPPYYDSVPYSDLSDFFYVWLKRALPGRLIRHDPWDDGNGLTPKRREAVRDEQNHLDGREKKTAEWYEQAMQRAFAEGRRVLDPDGIGTIVFAHKSTAGWESLLSGLVQAGWIVTASWPVATEMGTRLRARNSAVLATSIHLVCRPRPDEAVVGDWSEVLRELPGRVSERLEYLQREGITGADLVFACIGPALEIFSRHRTVETVDGREIALGEYLEHVWAAVGRAALNRVLGASDDGGAGDSAAFEEDARLTGLFLWQLQSGDADGASLQQGLAYDVVRRVAQPLGIRLDEWEDLIIRTEKGVVRLVRVKDRHKSLSDRAGDGDSTTLDRVHQAMLFQSAGETDQMRDLLKQEVRRGTQFVRLANALSALYPTGCDEKRLLDAMLLAVPK